MSKNVKGRKRKLLDPPVVQKKRKTLSDQIAELTDPTPQDFDIEEPHWDSAQTNYDEYEQQDFTTETSRQFKQVPAKKRLVSDIVMGPEYRGKRISRRNLFDADSDKESEVLSEEEPTPPSNDPSFNINLDESSSDDLDRDDGKEDDDDHNQEWEENEQEVNIQESDQGLARQMEADNLEKQFSTTTNPTSSSSDIPTTTTENLENQRKKAFHTMNQCAIWDTLVDLRINFQNLLEMGNRLPSPPDYVAFVGDPLVRDKFDHVDNAVQLLFGSLVKLQESLLVRDPVVKTEFSELSEKLEWEYLFQIQKKIEECSGPILDKWHTKALLPSTTVNRNQTLRLKSINQNITQQVSTTLSGNNLSNLIQRSQIVPEDSKKIFGAQPTPTQSHITAHAPDDDVPLHLPSVKSKPEKNYSSEIYNDEEFYTQIMREHIQSGIKGMGSTDDPIKMSQQYLQLRQLRRRKNKKSGNKDTKASKGRKLRYQVHDRLASFMAPQSQCYARQDSVLVERLFKSMFGSSGVAVRSFKE